MHSSSKRKVRLTEREERNEKIEEQREGGRQFQREGPIDAKDLDWTKVLLTQGRKRSWRSDEHRGWREEPDRGGSDYLWACAVRVDLCLSSLSELHLLSLIVPILVSFLADPEKLHQSPAIQRRLHDASLQKLIDIGPQYRTQFLAVLQCMPDLRTRFEAAVRAQHHQRPAQMSGSRGAAGGSQPGARSIQLKMDFSNFSA